MMITRKSSIHELELAGSNARFHVDLLTKAIYGATVPELLQKGVTVVSSYRTCPLCGAHLDPGEACDCVTVYTGHPGETYASMNIETGSIDVRVWRQDGNGSKTPLKGLQLTDAEASALCDALKEYNGGTYE